MSSHLWWNSPCPSLIGRPAADVGVGARLRPSSPRAVAPIVTALHGCYGRMVGGEGGTAGWWRVAGWGAVSSCQSPPDAFAFSLESLVQYALRSSRTPAHLLIVLDTTPPRRRHLRRRRRNFQFGATICLPACLFVDFFQLLNICKPKAFSFSDPSAKTDIDFCLFYKVFTFSL